MKFTFFLMLGTSALALSAGVATAQDAVDLGEIIIGFKNVLVPEINLGQFLRLIRAEYLVDAKGLNLVRGRPISASTIVETVKKTLG